jgi:hypothetical protein
VSGRREARGDWIETSRNPIRAPVPKTRDKPPSRRRWRNGVNDGTVGQTGLPTRCRHPKRHASLIRKGRAEDRGLEENRLTDRGRWRPRNLASRDRAPNTRFRCHENSGQPESRNGVTDWSPAAFLKLIASAPIRRKGCAREDGGQLSKIDPVVRVPFRYPHIVHAALSPLENSDDAARVWRGVCQGRFVRATDRNIVGITTGPRRIARRLAARHRTPLESLNSPKPCPPPRPPAWGRPSPPSSPPRLCAASS